MKGNIFVALILWQAGLISCFVMQTGCRTRSYLHTGVSSYGCNGTGSDFIIFDCDSGEQGNKEKRLALIHVF